MKSLDSIDLFWRKHPRLFLGAVLLLVIIVVAVVRITGATGSRVVYQAF